MEWQQCVWCGTWFQGKSVFCQRKCGVKFAKMMWNLYEPKRMRMIKIDIPMPENCLTCPFGPTDEESPFFDVWCILLKRMVDEYEAKKRQDDCPLKDCKAERENLLPCTCGCNRRSHIYKWKNNKNFERLVCMRCGLTSPWGVGGTGARRQWNEMIHAMDGGDRETD